MTFAHDTEESLRAAVVLVNSAVEPDTLTTVAELDAFYAAHRYRGAHAQDRAELESVRALRPRLRALLTADRDTAVGIVNAILRQNRAVPQLVRHDEFDYHLHALASSAPLADRIAVDTAMAMVDVIRSDEMSRLAVCAEDTCDGLVLDLSRNRCRRYCSATCGNRIAVAAYRARRG